MLGKAWSWKQKQQCCGQEDAVSTNWQSLAIHWITLLSQLNIDNSICGEAECKRQPLLLDRSSYMTMPLPYLLPNIFLLEWLIHKICPQNIDALNQDSWLRASIFWFRSYQSGLKRISSCNKCWWQNRPSQMKRVCYTLYFPYCHHAKRKMSRFLWSLYKILRLPSPLGLWQNFRRNIFWGTKQGTNVIFVNPGTF